MNRENIERLIYNIEGGHIRNAEFNMHQVQTFDGPVIELCIAGYALCNMLGVTDATKLWDARKKQEISTYSSCAAYLGIGEDEAYELFGPYSTLPTEIRHKKDTWSRITPTVAGDCLRNLLATGKVDWSSALKAA